MTADEGSRPRRRLRYEEIPADFQRDWLHARRLAEDQVELAFSHGLDASGRFGDRPFREVEEYLKESWDAMGTGPDWSEVADIVQTGYERYRAAGLDQAADPGPEAKDRAPRPPYER